MAGAFQTMPVPEFFILVCIRLFHRISKTAFLLMLPYLAWVSFAWILNAGFWWLN